LVFGTLAGRLDAEVLSVTRRVGELLQKLPRDINPVNLEELRRIKQTLVELENKVCSAVFLLNVWRSCLFPTFSAGCRCADAVIAGQVLCWWLVAGVLQDWWGSGSWLGSGSWWGLLTSTPSTF
jgi:hypothetical protein